MENSLEHIEVIIGKYLSGEASPDEKWVVENWIEANTENKKAFNQYRQLYDHSSLLKEQQQFDVDMAWASVKEKIQAKKIEAVSVKSNYASYWRVAASILLIVSAGLMIYKYLLAPQDVKSIESYTEAVQQVLPDGTETFLNKQSSISYRYNPIKKERVVNLKGEAFFEIKHAVNKEFVIEAEELIIKDIGTSFNVKAYPDFNEVEVFVQDGIVIMYTEDNPGLNLTAGETGIYNRVTKEFRKLEIKNENVIAYKTKSFVFEGNALQDIVNQLNQVYDQPIKLDTEKIGNCPITVSFNDESIDTIVDIISETLGLEVIKSEDGILLRGEGCGQ